jgi:hypothetical protein
MKPEIWNTFTVAYKRLLNWIHLQLIYQKKKKKKSNASLYAKANEV